MGRSGCRSCSDCQICRSSHPAAVCVLTHTPAGMSECQQQVRTLAGSTQQISSPLWYYDALCPTTTAMMEKDCLQSISRICRENVAKGPDQSGSKELVHEDPMHRPYPWAEPGPKCSAMFQQALKLLSRFGSLLMGHAVGNEVCLHEGCSCSCVCHLLADSPYSVPV